MPKTKIGFKNPTKIHCYQCLIEDSFLDDETEFDTYDENELAQCWFEFCKENKIITYTEKVTDEDDISYMDLWIRLKNSLRISADLCKMSSGNTETYVDQTKLQNKADAFTECIDVMTKMEHEFLKEKEGI